MRKIYEYMSLEEKKEVVLKLKEEIKKLKNELNTNGDLFSPFIRETLQSNYDRWNLEVEELELDIKNNKESV